MLVAALAALSTVTPTLARAFCRTTTCSPKHERCTFDDAGCNKDGVPVAWRAMPIPFRFHGRGPAQLVREEARAAVRAAFHRWSDAICPDGRRTSLRFAEGEDIVADKPYDVDAGKVEPFGVYFRDVGWPHEGLDSTLAQTNLSFGERTGRIGYADIEVNTTMRFSVDDGGDGADLQAVMTHEAGHYIGLAHSLAPQSIMAAAYCVGSDRCTKGSVAARRLAPDDLAAVCALYPPDGYATAPDEVVATGCETSPASPRGPAALGAAAVALLLALARLRRRTGPRAVL